VASMARKHRRAHGSPSSTMLEPQYSFQFVVAAMVSFLGLIGTMVFYSRMSHSQENRPSKNIFVDPDVVPHSLIQNLDAVIIAGGGAPSSLDVPPLYVQKRADDAAKIVHKFQQISLGGGRKSLPILCLSAGTAHVPQLLSPDGLPIWESTSTAAYLAKEHQLNENVYVETTSYDTIGNAYFTRTSHTDINGWRNLLIITNEFHMTRTAAIFDWIFLKCSSQAQRSDRYKLYYLSTPNVGLTLEAVEARRTREIESTQNVQENLSKQYTTLAKVWSFLNQEHSLYTTNSLIDRSRGLVKDDIGSDLLRKSYGLKDQEGY
jgi:uncharacterized SAM-binding protein YcdF (DUF218 family)